MKAGRSSCGGDSTGVRLAGHGTQKDTEWSDEVSDVKIVILFLNNISGRGHVR